MSVHVPITRLEPGIVDTATSHIKGVVTLLWPYSSATKAFSLLLVEPDFRLRRQKGQVRLTFRGSCAKSLARAGVVSGNELRIDLSGCRWLQEDPSSIAILTPGSSVGWELLFDKRLHLELDQNGRARTIDVDQGADSPQPNGPFEPRTPTVVPYTPFQTKDVVSLPVSIGSHDSWSSPAFLKKRTFNEALAPSSYDLFAGEKAPSDDPAPKRHKSGRESQQWRIVQDGSEDEESIPADAATAALLGEMWTEPSTLTEPRLSEPESADSLPGNALVLTDPAINADQVQIRPHIGFTNASNEGRAIQISSEEMPNLFLAASDNVLLARDDAETPLMDNLMDVFHNVDEHTPTGVDEDGEAEGVVENTTLSNTHTQAELQPTRWSGPELSRLMTNEVLTQTSPIAEEFDFDRQDDENVFEDQTGNDNTPRTGDLVDQVDDFEYVQVQRNQSADIDGDADSLIAETEAYESDADAEASLIDVESVVEDSAAHSEPTPAVSPVVVDHQPEPAQLEVIELSSEDESSESEAADSARLSEDPESEPYAAERHIAMSAEVATGQELERSVQDVEITDSSYSHITTQTETMSNIEELLQAQEQLEQYSKLELSGEDVLARSSELRGNNDAISSGLNEQNTFSGYVYQDHNASVGQAGDALLLDAQADNQEHAQLEGAHGNDEHPRILRRSERSGTGDGVMYREADEVSLIPESQPQHLELSTNNAPSIHDGDHAEFTDQESVTSGNLIADATNGSNVGTMHGRSLSIASSNATDQDRPAEIPLFEAGGTDTQQIVSPKLTNETVQDSSERVEDAENASQNALLAEATLGARVSSPNNAQQGHRLNLTSDEPRDSEVLDQKSEPALKPEPEPALRRSTRRTRQQSPEVTNDGNWPKSPPHTEDRSPPRRTRGRTAKLQGTISVSTGQEEHEPRSSSVEEIQTNRRAKPEGKQSSPTPERRVQARRSTRHTLMDLSLLEPQRVQAERSLLDQTDGTRGSPVPTTGRPDGRRAEQSDNDEESNIDQVSQQLLQEAQLAHDIEATLPPLSTGFHTKHAYLAPLSNLSPSNRATVDTMNLVVGATKPERASTGPRDWHLTLYVTDGSMQNASQALRSVQISRPIKSALPLSAAADDIVLLHGFKCESQRRKPMLISTAHSGWAVFDTGGKVKISGPTIEYGEDEVDLSQQLRSWWTSVPADKKMHLRTNFMQARDAAKEASRRKSGRKSIIKPGAMAHELRDGTVYPYTDTPLVSDE